MDDNFGTRVGLHQGQFDLVRDFMRLEKLYVAVHLQMELDEIGQPGLPGSQIMNRVNAVVRERDIADFFALFIGQFPIHQHIERALHDKVGAPNDVDRDCGSKERVRERPSGFGNNDDGGNNHPVHQQVPFVVQGIGADRDGL